MRTRTATTSNTRRLAASTAPASIRRKLTRLTRELDVARKELARATANYQNVLCNHDHYLYYGERSLWTGRYTGTTTSRGHEQREASVDIAASWQRHAKQRVLELESEITRLEAPSSSRRR